MKEERELTRVLGENIRNTRINKNLTQENLAEMVGVIPQTISNIERGIVATKISRLERISNCLEIRPYELLIDHDIDKIISAKEHNQILKSAMIDSDPNELETVESKEYRIHH